ncbi:hypothetical protein [Mameliella sediminis]|uniref:hypothetical protein n=1 Tax=Mameliella sediminis TaxID=2836866 RepID=UPI001C4939F4|nr:hypothetical protein [Mameliella sediminis]MBV7395047.1 hypothetical protein [Mameliella sediminis]
MAMQTTALNSADVTPGSAVDAAVQGRANIFEMTQAAEDAVMRPTDTGSFSHALRAALAARIARLNDEPELAARYAKDAGDFATLADPTKDGSAQDLAAITAFMDKVAADTRRVAAPDISGLQAAGIADADIVRLCELNAFLAYQIRVIAGLRLMKGAYE